MENKHNENRRDFSSRFFSEEMIDQYDNPNSDPMIMRICGTTLDEIIKLLEPCREGDD